MANNTYKNLGQSAPSATTETTIYTVPAATEAVISSIVVCNRSGAADTFRIAHNVGGGATATKDYLCYGHRIGANDTVTLTLGITMAAFDTLKVYAGTANLSFNVYGTEIA